MKRSDFNFELPPEQIAQYPTKQRTASRLLTLDGNNGTVSHHQFSELIDFLLPGDLLVLNNTQVIPARLHGYKTSGGKVEVLVERVLTEEGCVLAHVRANKRPKIGSELCLADELKVEVCAYQEELIVLKFLDTRPVIELLEKYGHIPLPPYIDRPDTLEDWERYQTVYGDKKGAVAAPTAGLHFDQDLLKSITKKDIELAYVTLHVGAGTFQSMRVDEITEHKMHSEYMVVDEMLCEQVKACKARGGRVVAVGTTSVRCLETAARQGEIKPFQGETSIFIYPGYKFQIVDALLTNFHLPESTLIMLVSAFAGRERVLEAYRQAVVAGYRFFSYGDAMFITPEMEGTHKGHPYNVSENQG